MSPYDPEPPRCVVCDARNPEGAACKGTWCPREDGIRKERIRKDEFDAGNAMHFRLRSRGGGYRYYVRVENEGPRPWTEIMGDPVAEMARKLDAGS